MEVLKGKTSLHLMIYVFIAKLLCFISHGRPGWEFPTEQNISATEFNGGRSRAIGYIAVSYLDISNTNNVSR
jgi:hypothetical protein